MILLENASKLYANKVLALDGASFYIDRSEFVFIVGPSGAGKSTLVRLIYREELPTSGRVVVFDKDLSKMRPREVPFFRRRIGVVFQDFKLLEDRTVFENVAFALRVTESTRREIKRRVPAVLELVGLRDKQRSYPRQLSGGEQQRVSLARAIVNNPELVVADEPTGNLDPDTAWEIFQLLREINRRGTTVVVATHAKEIVNRFGKRVIALKDGQVVRDEEKGAYSNED